MSDNMAEDPPLKLPLIGDIKIKCLSMFENKQANTSRKDKNGKGDKNKEEKKIGSSKEFVGEVWPW